MDLQSWIARGWEPRNCAVSISPGNVKIGKCPNVSLTPGRACPAGVPCAGGKCYAMKAYRQYPSVKTAWDSNFELATGNSPLYFGNIMQYCAAKRPAFFRWHVAGDILSPGYFAGMAQIAHWSPSTLFLCFTKRHDIINQRIATLGAQSIPANLRIMFSAWPGAELVNPYGMPVAWLTTDDRRPRSVFTCPGNCGPCRHCWVNKKGVAFDPH